MKKCYFSKKHQISTTVSFILFIVMGFVTIGTGIYILFIEPESAYVSVKLFILAVGFFLLSFLCYAAYGREYSVSESGIAIFYFRRFKVEHPWSQIGQISVCDINYAAKADNVFDIVIRVVVGEEKDGPASNLASIPYGRHIKWRQMEYNMMHFKTIINIEYTRERLEEIQTASKKSVAYFLMKSARAALREE